MENLKENYSGTPNRDEDEIDLLDLWRTIWKRRKMIAWVVGIMTVGTVIVSLFMTNIYQASAVITPVDQKQGQGGGLRSMMMEQLGGLAGLALPGGSSANEIVSLLDSKVLGEKIITRYNLLPILFDEKWDAKKKTWKIKEGWSLNPLSWISSLFKLIMPAPPASVQKKDPNVPDVWDGLRELDEMVNVKFDMKKNSITITADSRDPELSAKLVDYYLLTLTDYMSSEARRVALTNRNYLESQLNGTSDPLIKQKIYNMIAQQIETSMMAEVKENFAFKVLDPPKVPDKKIKPKRAQMVILAFFVAMFLGVFAAFGAEYVQKMKAASQKKTS